MRAGGGACTAGAAAVRWVDGQHAARDERLEAGAVVLDRSLPVPGRAAATGVLELIRRHPRTCVNHVTRHRYL